MIDVGIESWKLRHVCVLVAAPGEWWPLMKGNAQGVASAAVDLELLNNAGS
jgi:hypothetical protein